MTLLRNASTGYRVRRTVSHERLGDEVVIIDYDTGNYFGLQKVAAVIWGLLGNGAAVDQVLQEIGALYPDARDREAEVIRFLDDLLREQLIEEIAAPPPRAIPATAVTSFEAPVLEKYTDMRDLLLLDPIHQVNALDWPLARRDGDGGDPGDA